MTKENYCVFIDKGARIKFRDTDDGLHAMSQPCCHMTRSYMPPEAKKWHKVSSADDVMNHDTLKFYREYFKNNDDLPKSCMACINQESKGLDSSRTRNNEIGYEGYDIAILDVMLGNSCNLACPFCSSQASSLIDKLSRKLSSDQRPLMWGPAQDSEKGSVKTPEMVTDILNKYKVHTLKVIGGEPFLKENWDQLSGVFDSENAKHLHLDVTSNGTILNDDILERMNKTKSAHLRLSVDSIGKNYEFIRWPHRWHKMDENLEYLRFNPYRNIHISVNNLVNIFSFEFLPEVEEYFSDVISVVGFSLEIKPVHHIQSYQNLPEHIIDDVRKKLKRPSFKKGLVRRDSVYSKEQIKKEFQVLLNQRKMKAEDVIGPMTREWLEL